MPEAYPDSRPRPDDAELIDLVASIGPAGRSAGPCKGPERPSPREVFAPRQADARLAEKVAAHVLGGAAGNAHAKTGAEARMLPEVLVAESLATATARREAWYAQKVAA